MSLGDLTDERLTTEQIATFNNTLRKENDRSVVIMTSALVEQELMSAIRSKLPHIQATDVKAWFTGPTAPFRTFEAKTRLGRALDIYDKSVEVRLDTIRQIRNVFAHRPLPIDLDHPAFAKLMTVLDPRPVKDDTPLRFVFGAYALAGAQLLRAIADETKDRPLHSDESGQPEGELQQPPRD